MAGEGMVTPRRPMTIEEDGVVETLPLSVVAY
jgi:hypothetical protein